MTDEFELQARRSKMAQFRKLQDSDPVRTAQLEVLLPQRQAQTVTGLEILERFWRSGDVVALRDELGQWCHGPGFAAYGGVNGQMFLNQLVSYSPDADALARLLGRCLRAPSDDEQARAFIRELAAHAESVKKGAHPAPRRSMFFLSFFWSLQDGENWPCFWPSAEAMTRQLGWLPPIDEYGDLYIAFRSLVLELGEAQLNELALFWVSEQKVFTGLDPSIIERCRVNVEVASTMVDDSYRDAMVETRAASNARAIIGELALAGQALADQVAEALGRSVKVETPSLFWARKYYRGDGWVRWGVTDEGGSPPASLRLWVTPSGIFIGLHPGWYRNGWYSEARRAVADVIPSSCAVFPVRSDDNRVDPEPDDRWEGEFLLGVHSRHVASNPSQLARQVVGLAADLQPALDRLVAQFGGRVGKAAQPANDPMRARVQQFIEQRPYPSDKDDNAKADRAMMAAQLAPDEVTVMDLVDLRRIYNSNRYANPGPQSVLNSTLRDATPAELQDYLERIHFLLWGEGDDADRIDELLDPNRKYIKGLGESVIMKLLSIVKPETYLPVFPYSGDFGKARFLKAFGLELPDPKLSPGRRQVAANGALRSRLDPLFPNDPWGQAQFMYWLVQQPSAEEVTTQTEADVLAALADELLVGREFIAEVVALLREKGQVVFYGPPGTGKTFVARALAKALAPDPTRRAIVQFHPSTSYEDFFEGFRPEESGGQLSYQLRKGPLALMAEKAEAAPGVAHVIVIDELNRANLPKVFGELLFLLEYRDEEVRTLYRPDDAFSLPENLYFIGTMNTADRSIALVDAALRRRFHFIPFFPDDGEMDGLLRRWLDRAKEPTWVADLVEMVNAELVAELGGPDLQIGPSYFMKKGIEDRLPAIWRYNIEPLIQDQLFGQGGKIKEFGWDAVRARFKNELPTVGVGGDDTA